jgi:hypothetical protein
LGGKSVKYGQVVLELLEAIWASKWSSVMHCKGTRGGDNRCSGNQTADREAKQAALTGGQNLSLTDSCLVSLPLIWMGSMVYFTRTGLIWARRRKFPVMWMVEICQRPYRNSRVVGSHISQAIP